MSSAGIKLKGDKGIWVVVLILSMFSVVAVFSSSTYIANKAGESKLFVFLDQIKVVLSGFAALLLCYFIPMRWYRRLSFILFGISVAMLLGLYVPSLRAEVNGAVRGLKIAGRTIQVFEFAKIGLILYLAKAIEYWAESLNTFKDFALKLLLPVVGVCLLVMGNSFSSALLFGIISFMVMFFMQVNFKYIAISIAGALAILILMFGIYNAFYSGSAGSGEEKKSESSVAKLFNRFGTVQNRILNFSSDASETEMESMSEEERTKILDEIRQSENAKIAISEGGIIGKGPGKSTQRYSLSMAFSDFIYAFIVEEYGLVGGCLLIFVYLMFLFRCIVLASRCKALYTSSLVLGLGFLITTQAFLHILVNVRLIPITGHTLPLVSHGGTAFLVLCGAFGIILSVSKQLDKQDRLAMEAQAKEAAEAVAGQGSENNLLTTDCETDIIKEETDNE